MLVLLDMLRGELLVAANDVCKVGEMGEVGERGEVGEAGESGPAVATSEVVTAGM
jgi:hypothetical protein